MKLSTAFTDYFFLLQESLHGVINICHTRYLLILQSEKGNCGFRKGLVDSQNLLKLKSVKEHWKIA